MLSSFEHIELLDQSSFDDKTSSLNIISNPSAKVILLRGLIGSIKFKHTLTQTEFDQSIDYFDLVKANASVGPFERLRNYISTELSIEELAKIFGNRRFLRQNHTFFERLNKEFCNYYYYESKGSHTTAFAYLYRILETISFAFPLIYASKTEDFKGTYVFLKECLSGSREKGELGFFKSFIKVVFKNDPLFESSITIDILGDTEEIQKCFYDSFLKACPDSNIYDATDTEEPRRISIKFYEYSSFIINIRNRFFHLFNSGQPNLQSDDILDADHFFKLVNKQTTYWISLILLEVLKFNIVSPDES